MVNKIVNNDMQAALDEEMALVDFSAVWCGPCKMTAPVIESLSEKFAGQVGFYNADVDDNMEIAVKYGIQNIPALALMKKGKIVSSRVGFQPEAMLEQWIRDNM
jgi:thioredoxin 1